MHSPKRNNFKFYYFFLVPYLDYSKKSFLKIKPLHFADYLPKGVMYMIHVREDVALVDQIVLNNIEILHIADIKQLIKQDIVEISTHPMQYTMADEQEFTRLTIKNDGIIDYMIAGAIYRPHQKINYCNITLSVKNTSFGNLCCYTVQEYRQKLKEIQNHLLNTYGIEVAIDKASIREIEINKTFALCEPYENYYRVVKLIMHNLPAELHIQMYCTENGKEKNKPGTFYACTNKTKSSNRFTTLKIYDKSSALSAKLKITLDKSYMRIELRFSGTQKIKRALTTNSLALVTDDMINVCYQRYMKRYIYNPYNKWRKKRNNYVLEMIQKQRSFDIRHWQINILRILSHEEINNGFATLLDVEELFPLLTKLDLSSKRQYAIRQNFYRHAAEYETAFNQRDNIKLTEILKKLGYID